MIASQHASQSTRRTPVHDVDPETFRELRTGKRSTRITIQARFYGDDPHAALEAWQTREEAIAASAEQQRSEQAA